MIHQSPALKYVQGALILFKPQSGRKKVGAELNFAYIHFGLCTPAKPFFSNLYQWIQFLTPFYQRKSHIIPYR